MTRKNKKLDSRVISSEKHRSSKSIKKSNKYRAEKARVAEFGGDPQFIHLTLESDERPVPPRERESEDAPYNPGLFDVNLGNEAFDPYES